MVLQRHLIEFAIGRQSDSYMMDNQEEDDSDLKLVKASSTLLADLEKALLRLLWRPSRTGFGHGRVHSQVKNRDLEYVLKLVRNDTTLAELQEGHRSWLAIDRAVPKRAPIARREVEAHIAASC